jgi:hypothetical protein
MLATNGNIGIRTNDVDNQIEKDDSPHTVVFFVSEKVLPCL